MATYVVFVTVLCLRSVTLSRNLCGHLEKTLIPRKNSLVNPSSLSNSSSLASHSLTTRVQMRCCCRRRLSAATSYNTAYSYSCPLLGLSFECNPIWNSSKGTYDDDDDDGNVWKQLFMCKQPVNFSFVITYRRMI